MNNLSCTRAFFLCALNMKGSTTLTHSIEASSCLLASCLLELLEGNYLIYDDKQKMFVNNPLPADKIYLAPVYELIRINKPMKLEKIAEKYVFDSKKANALFQSIGHSLVDDGYVDKANSKGLFTTKIRFTPKAHAVSQVGESLRKAVLTEQFIPDDRIALVVLLNKSGYFKEHFAKDELKVLKEKLHVLKQTDTSVLINKLIGHIEMILVFFISSIN
ncbi:Golgi phosphoprotein 3 (GPP34) [Amphibacillus marinus]|uniref:Golgi phosphoprotein 3 (GPP34) n=1 Tax=Amphibacillus marinus TaxID=872970 RepID=A0A1H8H0X2_9BACI|nr:GPP34 family phosphoprotein [Amphibacillus marinus]SEN49992.1 Golgi phosphoprotein 3 (GPP34) [Amphibacillus marinus]